MILPRAEGCQRYLRSSLYPFICLRGKTVAVYIIASVDIVKRRHFQHIQMFSRGDGDARLPAAALDHRYPVPYPCLPELQRRIVFPVPVASLPHGCETVRPSEKEDIADRIGKSRSITVFHHAKPVRVAIRDSAAVRYVISDQSPVGTCPQVSRIIFKDGMDRALHRSVSRHLRFCREHSPACPDPEGRICIPAHRPDIIRYL